VAFVGKCGFIAEAAEITERRRNRDEDYTD
jgi:hypothetical protein